MPRGARRLPDACVAELRAADVILHCGDLMRAEVLEELRAFGPPVHAIRGNVDDPGIPLPGRLELDFDGVRIGMIHDSGQKQGRLARLRAWFPAADAVLFGHSHLPLHEERDGFQIFNPGSPTERRRAPAHTMGIAEIADGDRHLRAAGGRLDGAQGPLRRDGRQRADRPPRPARDPGQRGRRPAAVRLRGGDPAPAAALGRAARPRRRSSSPTSTPTTGWACRGCSRPSTCARGRRS